LVIKYNAKQIATAKERGKIDAYNDIDVDDLELYANGCSLVIHPKNP
jgi:coproporphyrinogen III oxidase